MCSDSVDIDVTIIVFRHSYFVLDLVAGGRLFPMNFNSNKVPNTHSQRVSAPSPAHIKQARDCHASNCIYVLQRWRPSTEETNRYCRSAFDSGRVQEEEGFYMLRTVIKTDHMCQDINFLAKH